jgi:hypothetical protein
MKAWDRAQRDQRCGLCGEHIETGAAVLVLRIGHLVKVRGVCCAGPAPPDLPPYVERVSVVDTRPFVPLRLVADSLPLDWRRRSAGDRDPGEEG